MGDKYVIESFLAHGAGHAGHFAFETSQEMFRLHFLPHGSRNLEARRFVKLLDGGEEEVGVGDAELQRGDQSESVDVVDDHGGHAGVLLA